MNGKKKLILLSLGFFCFVNYGKASSAPDFLTQQSSLKLYTVEARYGDVTLVLYFNLKGEVVYSWEKLCSWAATVSSYDLPSDVRNKIRKEMGSPFTLEMIDSEKFLQKIKNRGEWCAQCLYELKTAINAIDFEAVRRILIKPRVGTFLRSQKGLLIGVCNEFSDLKYLPLQEKQKMRNILDYLKAIARGKIPA